MSPILPTRTPATSAGPAWTHVALVRRSTTELEHGFCGSAAAALTVLRQWFTAWCEHQQVPLTFDPMTASLHQLNDALEELDDEYVLAILGPPESSVTSTYLPATQPWPLLTEQIEPTPPPATPNALAWHASIISRNGEPDIHYAHSYDEAMGPLRRWSGDYLREQHPEDRRDTISEIGTLAATTVERLNSLFHNGDSGYWMDIVPADQVLPRILPSLLLDWNGPTAVITLDGCCDVDPYPSAAAAEASLRAQAHEWDLDDPTLDPATATLDRLCAAYTGDSPRAWIGLLPILTSGSVPLALVPLDYLPTDL